MASTVVPTAIGMILRIHLPRIEPSSRVNTTRGGLFKVRLRRRVLADDNGASGRRTHASIRPADKAQAWSRCIRLICSELGHARQSWGTVRVKSTPRSKAACGPENHVNGAEVCFLI